MKYISALISAGKSGVEIAFILFEKRKCSLDEAVKAFTSLGYWTVCLPFDERWMALHITDRPLIENDPTIARLKKFGNRALPFCCWTCDEPYQQVNNTVAVNTPDFLAAAVEVQKMVSAIRERGEQISTPFVWVAGKSFPRKLHGLLDLSEANEIVIETEDDEYLEIIGFDDHGHLTLGLIVPFSYDDDQYTLTILGKSVLVTENAEYEQEIFVKGKIVIRYDPLYRDEE